MYFRKWQRADSNRRPWAYESPEKRGFRPRKRGSSDIQILENTSRNKGDLCRDTGFQTSAQMELVMSSSAKRIGSGGPLAKRCAVAVRRDSFSTLVVGYASIRLLRIHIFCKAYDALQNVCVSAMSSFDAES